LSNTGNITKQTPCIRLTRNNISIRSIDGIFNRQIRTYSNNTGADPSDRAV